jgi:hypothetical protein
VSVTERTHVGAASGNGFRGKAAGRAALLRTTGPSPLLVIGVAFALGVVLAKWIDWRGHAHPR